MHKVIDLAIIIPSLNEEHYIGRLLDSIALQTVSPKELVVVDARSQDNTIEEIKKRQKSIKNLRFYQIPQNTISRQRNFGVKKTTATRLLFLDADTVLKEKDILEKYFNEIGFKNPDVSAAFNKPLSDYWKDRVFFWIMNTTFKLAKPVWPMVTGMNLYLSRQAFKKLKGFDEKVRVGEDFDLVQRAVRVKLKFIFLTSVNVYTSVRRYAREGRIRFILKIVKSSFRVLRYGHKKNSMEYEFGNFKKN